MLYPEVQFGDTHPILDIPDLSPFSALADDAPIVIWVTDAEGNCTYLSRLWFETTGQSDAEGLGLGWVNAIHAEDRDAARATFADANRARSAFQHEYRLCRAGGGWAWVIDTGKPRFSKEGDFLGYTGCVLDVSDRRRVEHALQDSVEHHRHSVELNPHVFWTATSDGMIVEASPGWYSLTGMKAGDALGAGWLRAVHPADVAAATSAWSEALRTKSRLEVEYRLAMRDGPYRWFRAQAAPRFDDHGSVVLWYGSLEDIHDRKLTNAALRESEERLRLALDASKLGVIDVDLATDGHRWSDRVKEMLGLSPETFSTYDVYLSLVHPEDRAYVETQRLAAHDSAGTFVPSDVVRMTRADTGELRYHERHVAQLRNEAGEVYRLVLTLRDITERQKADEKIRWIATHDASTGLPNRDLFQLLLSDALTDAEQKGEQLALAVIDVDDFKLVNDSLGHAAGDAVIETLGSRLQRCVGPFDIAARLGGDEFGLLIRSFSAKVDLEERINGILNELELPVMFEGSSINCFLSVGASRYPQDGKKSDVLLKNADVALFAAKAARRGGLIVFDPTMRAEAERRATMLNLARSALEHDDIFPFYQPKIDLRSGSVDGFEALLRWRDEGDCVQLPSSIVAAFEDSQLAMRLSDRMFERVIADMRHWLDAGVQFGHIGVNVTAAEFGRNDLAERLLERLRRADITPAHLELEVTESVFLGRGAEHVERALNLLSEAGVSIALDDFGTGYASLTHLRRFPVNCIKIDRSFVCHVKSNKDDDAIIKAVLDLGRSLGMKVVAEGIETDEQAAHLAAEGCIYGQGFHLGRPMPACAVGNFIARLEGAVADESCT